jgi:PHD/YefM family antitoxin component YafN of YafNO toxin-antitoxin module
MTLPTDENVSTVTDIRRDTIGFLKDVKKKGMKYIFQQSKLKAITLSVEEYELWMERLEDLQDQIRFMQLEKEERGEGISLEDAAKEYGVKL